MKNTLIVLCLIALALSSVACTGDNDGQLNQDYGPFDQAGQTVDSVLCSDVLVNNGVTPGLCP